MEALPKIVRQRLRSGNTPGGHPHADLLTAFAEKALTERERTRVMEHLSRCEDCREVMFLSASQEAPVQALGKIPGRAGWLSWPVLRWGAAVACVVVVGTAVTLRHESSKRLVLRERAVSEKAQGVATFISPAEMDARTTNPNSSAELRNDAAQTRKRVDEDKLVAKLEAPGRPSPKAMTAIPKFQMKFDQSRPSNGNEVAGLGTGVGGGVGRGAGPAVAASAPALVAKGANPVPRPENDEKQLQAGSVSETVTVTGANETVEVEASAPPVQTSDAALAKSKDASTTALPTNGRDVQPLANLNAPKAVPGAAESYAKKELDRTSILVPHWMLTPNGVLQRSVDAGKTWETVAVADRVSFQALATIASDIWVGGANGKLYHSSDAGQHWTQVIPKSNGEALRAGITRIEFSDVQNGKVTTDNGESWTTSDAGKTWQKN